MREEEEREKNGRGEREGEENGRRCAQESVELVEVEGVEGEERGWNASVQVSESTGGANVTERRDEKTVEEAMKGGRTGGSRSSSSSNSSSEPSLRGRS